MVESSQVKTVKGSFKQYSRQQSYFAQACRLPGIPTAAAGH